MSSLVTLREKICASLREAIVNGDILPGARLQEIEIAKNYNTSRTPVREALRQLESEGFVNLRARRGAIVTPITEQDILEFYEIKGVLEAHAAKLAGSRLSESDINRMEDLNRKVEESFLRGEVTETVEAHNKFHQVFVDASGNARLAEMINGLVAQFQRFRIVLSHTETVRESVEQHRDIIAAFRRRDPEGAARMVLENSQKGCEALISKIRVRKVA